MINKIIKQIKSLQYNYAKVIVFSKSGNSRIDWLKYDAKNKAYLLFNRGNEEDITYLDISIDDLININGKKYLFLNQIDIGKYQKCKYSFSNASFETLDVNLKIWLADKIRKNNEDYQKEKKWYENPTIVVGGIVVIVMLISFWFVGNYKEGGVLVDSIKQLVSSINDIKQGLINSGIINKVTEPLA